VLDETEREMFMHEPHQLPLKTIFPNSAPRYPNVWIHVACSLCSSYDEALKLVLYELEACTGMANDFGYFHNAEGCDAFAQRRGLQPIRLDPGDLRSHDHAMHIRFFAAPLRHLPPVKAGGLEYYQIAASVHYEVDRPRHLHSYVDECPECGCTDEYAVYMDASHTDKDERVHDPLGVEILLFGTIRGEKIIAFNGMNSLEGKYGADMMVIEPWRDDMNTARLGLVFLNALL
jgi:hypothetical protein